MAAALQARERRPVGGDDKRARILDAARRVFAAEGLDGASLRAIAAAAGYTPAALYFHFASKEAIYAALLHESLQRLRASVEQAVSGIAAPVERFRRAALAFFAFYEANPGDLDLGFYLFRGGMKPQGLGRAHDEALNAALAAALAPVAAAAEAMGADADRARLLTLDVFAHAAGLLLLAHTGRIRMFGASAARQMDAYVARQLAELQEH